MLKAITLSRMAMHLTKAELQGCMTRLRDPLADDLKEHDEYALSMKCWSVGTEEKLAVLIFEDLQRKEGGDHYTPVVVTGVELAAFAKAQVQIYNVRLLRVRTRS